MKIPAGPIIGVDESGKGDFFGPLVIGGVLISAEDLPCFEEWGVRDSKKISDNKIKLLAEKIKNRCKHNLVVINPEKYNQMYSKIKNLNKLLGWGHARVIENILAENMAVAAISDKFGHDRFISDRLLEEGKKITMIQKVRGEAHPAVAAASILARAEFLRRMYMMSTQYQVEFPRGASAKVDDTGKKLIVDHGRSFLGKVSKLHFKNYHKIVC